MKKDNKELQYQLRCTTGREKGWERNCKFWDKRCEELQQQLDQLKVENEELKRQHQGDKGLITSTGKMNYQLMQEYDKLKNCLTEIKEIAEEEVHTRMLFADKESFCDFNKILQKISNCEVENAR